MALDVASIREHFPALQDGTVYLDGAGGTQVPEAVIDAITAVYRAGVGNAHGVFADSRRSDDIVTGARSAVADLTGGSADGVILGPNSTTLTYRLSYALAKTWQPGDEIVLSQLDHDANIRPWVQAAERAGAVVRWALVDPVTGELPAEQYAGLVGDRTRLVAVTAASNLIGTIPDVAAITATAHQAGALTWVDGVAAAPHLPIDVAALGADFLTTSAYKWCGPHVGALVADSELLASLTPDKLVPSPNGVPEKFETGTSPFADLAGVTAAVDFLAGPGSADDRRSRVLSAMSQVVTHEQSLLAELLTGLSTIDGVRLIGQPRRRTPIVYFDVAGCTPLEVAQALARARVNVWHGHAYAWELVGALGVRQEGAVRCSLAHYNSAADVQRFLDVVASLGR